MVLPFGGLLACAVGLPQYGSSLAYILTVVCVA